MMDRRLPPIEPDFDWRLPTINSMFLADQHNTVTAASESAQVDRPRRNDHLPMTADVRDGMFGNRPLTEAGNAFRMLDLHGHNIRYVHSIGAWLFWDQDGVQGHWVWDYDGARVRTLAAQLPAALYGEASVAERKDPTQSKHLLEWARKTQGKRTIDATASLLSDRHEIRVTIDQVDGDPMLAGIDGARKVIDLRNGSVRPATRDDLVTKSFKPRAVGKASRATRWERFLREIFRGDQELVDWMQRFCGYILTGSTQEQIFLFAHGKGSNGKSVLLSMLATIMGDYARTIQPESLMVQNRNAGGSSSDVARLAGSRLVTGSETEAGRPLAEAAIKNFTGATDVIVARELYGKEFEFKPIMKLILAGNHRPIIKGNDDGIWRRVVLVPFLASFRKASDCSAEMSDADDTPVNDPRPIADPKLVEALEGESDHILAWMVDGCSLWQQYGLGDLPAAIRSATQNYKTEQDVLGEWISERTDPHGTAMSGDLYADYRQWAETGGMRPMTIQAFGRQLRDRDYVAKPVRKGTQFIGISLTNETPPI